MIKKILLKFKERRIKRLERDIEVLDDRINICWNLIDNNKIDERMIEQYYKLIIRCYIIKTQKMEKIARLVYY